MKKFILTFGAAMAAGVVAQAATVVWQTQSGTGSNAWTESLWTVDGTPNQTTSQTITDNNVTVTTGSATLTATALTVGTGGKLTLNAGTIDVGGTIAVSGGGAGAFTLNGSTVLTANDFNITSGSIQTINGGTITLTAVNALRGFTFAENGLNITAGAGGFSLTQTNNATPSTSLARKVAQGYFRIDGTWIKPTDTTDVAALNAELDDAAYTVNGKYFQVEVNGGNQTLVVVPEPSSSVLLGLSALGLVLRRRRA